MSTRRWSIYWHRWALVGVDSERRGCNSMGSNKIALNGRVIAKEALIGRAVLEGF